MEIEKKYQIKEMPCLDGAMTKEMEQGYLCTDPVVRIRRSNDKYILTCKSFDGMIGERRADVRMCQEYEINLSEESYKHLRQKVDGGLISKTRYINSVSRWAYCGIRCISWSLRGTSFC